jgi:hypothetical protein
MIEPENRQRRRPVGQPWLTVPASARTTERYRLGEPNLDADAEEEDEDLAFLSTLVSQAEREASQPREAPAPRPRRFSVQADPSLDVFRETAVERQRPRVLRNMRVEDVEIDDLLEQLSTTAAALRRRRAA